MAENAFKRINVDAPKDIMVHAANIVSNICQMDGKQKTSR